MTRECMQKISRLLPPQDVNKINQKCYFYHSKGSCRWGNYCRYTHKIKCVPKVLFNSFYMPSILPRAETSVPEYKGKLQKIRDDLGKQEIAEYMATIRKRLLNESMMDILPLSLNRSEKRNFTRRKSSGSKMEEGAYWLRWKNQPRFSKEANKLNKSCIK